MEKKVSYKAFKPKEWMESEIEDCLAGIEKIAPKATDIHLRVVKTQKRPSEYKAVISLGSLGTRFSAQGRCKRFLSTPLKARKKIERQIISRRNRAQSKKRKRSIYLVPQEEVPNY